MNKDRQAWPAAMRERLAAVGIDEYESLATIKSKIDALGLTIETAREDPGGFLSTSVLYYAQVSDRRNPEASWGSACSASDIVDALIWAVEQALDFRAEYERDRQERIASPEPDEIVLVNEFGGTVAGARERGVRYPGILSAPDLAAHVLVGEEIVIIIPNPARRFLPEWTSAQEDRLRAILRDVAQTRDLRERRGPVTLVFDPGTEREAREGIKRLDAGFDA